MKNTKKLQIATIVTVEERISSGAFLSPLSPPSVITSCNELWDLSLRFGYLDVDGMVIHTHGVITIGKGIVFIHSPSRYPFPPSSPFSSYCVSILVNYTGVTGVVSTLPLTILERNCSGTGRST